MMNLGDVSSCESLSKIGITLILVVEMNPKEAWKSLSHKFQYVFTSL
jgi:hypothetical protein